MTFENRTQAGKLLAEKLNGINEGKYKVINAVISDIEKRLAEKEIGKIIFEASDQWPAGVIRWAAQKFRDKYSRPVFIFNITGGKAKGSIRSSQQFNVVEAMKEIGIDISQNKTKSVFDFYKQGKQYDYVITVCDESQAAKCPIFPGAVCQLHWGFDDPAGFKGSWEEKLEETRQVRDKIKQKLENWIK